LRYIFHIKIHFFKLLTEEGGTIIDLILV
jgi:hypothetical protein